MRPEKPEPSGSKTEQVIDDLKDYLNTNIEILRLNAIDKAASGIASVSVFAILAFLFLCIFILASIGLALVISHAIGNGFSGFFIVAGAYLLLGLLLYAGRDTLVKKVIANRIIDQLWNDRPNI